MDYDSGKVINKQFYENKTIQICAGNLWRMAMRNSEKRKIILNKIGTMIPHMVSLVSIIISILTLHEMRVERNHAYLPRVTVEESVCRWDSDYTLLKTPYSTIMNLNYLPVFLQTTAGHTLVVDNAILYENPNIIVSNIGNGIAENITYIFDENNEWSKKIIQLLNKMNSDSPFSLLEDKKQEQCPFRETVGVLAAQTIHVPCNIYYQIVKKTKQYIYLINAIIFYHYM